MEWERYGITDARDFKRLAAVYDGLQVYKDKIIHAVDYQLTYAH
jgi:hypothetical protein